jgi:ribonuclease HI
MINVYIDGACSNNGSENAIAGYGIFFKHGDPRNESKRINGKSTNNTGELSAFIRTLEILENEIINKEIIHIYTDSEYVIKCISTYGSKLEQKQWISKKQIPNLELVKKAYYLYKNKENIKIHHIEAHTNNTDIHSLGNKEADKLACLAVGKEQKENKDIIILDWITFDTKDEAKKLGAKWNPEKKYWYVENTISSDNMLKLEELDKTINIKLSAIKNEDKIYINISFSKKDKAKKFGAKWDSVKKSWYYNKSTINDDNITELKKLINI